MSDRSSDDKVSEEVAVGRIVVGVDGSDGAAKALRWAAREAAARDWSVTALMAWGLLDQHQPMKGAEFDPHYDEAQARAALDRYVEAALGTLEATPRVDREVVCDVATSALLDAAKTADLLVVGARGRGGFHGLLVGSVSETCIHHSPSPIVVVRGAPDRLDRLGHIVVGVDGSSVALRALGWAIHEARAHQASVDGVYAWAVPYLAGDAVAAPVFDTDALEAAARRLVEEMLASVDTTGLAGPVTQRVEAGTAAATILRVADAADLVVVGSRGFGTLKRLLVGSVSHQVVHHAPCPVLVVPPQGAPVERRA